MKLTRKCDSWSIFVYDWKITDGKIIRIQAWIETENGTEAEVYVEHVHIDMFIHAGFSEKPEEMSDYIWVIWQERAAQINGILQDSMDDTFHYYHQPGFSLNNGYKYDNRFSVEGFSEYLISGWGTMVTYCGYGTGNGALRIEE